ncbi:G8 domain-containing protein [Lyngbya confervoides]|uniref:PKD domain-containing protein n=1 Tax=Lyngbya confervoides BDU141951 TaxID=1574623 RepID=A0ABD4SZ63_9CYAN|nr:G8 domain-containing protein [Lyngbya confervoides]MCM1981756.1 PKD domain-containing protein [Lyngbya confervoides BDU141951]
MNSRSEKMEKVKYEKHRVLKAHQRVFGDSLTPPWIDVMLGTDTSLGIQSAPSSLTYDAYGSGSTLEVSTALSLDSIALTQRDLTQSNAEPQSMTMSMDPTMPHASDPVKHGEHMGLLNLLPHGAETHRAVNSGSWFHASTWLNGQIPGENARVLIPVGIEVIYDAESDLRFDTVRIDGGLTFSSSQNTKMVVDTLFSDTTGTLTIGTAHNPIQADKTARIIIDSQDAVSDALQLGKGVITHGTTRIYGAEKLDFVSLQDAQAGDNVLTLNLPTGMLTPQGWQIGDQLVLGGTGYNRQGSNQDNSRFQDEVLIITAINGNQIRFINRDIITGDNTVLRFNHRRPPGFTNETNLYVANLSRNVSISSEQGKDTPLAHRGHVMFMHNPDVQVVNAGFYDLGRSNKNQIVDDVGTNRDGTAGNGTNVRGRYALHFHRTGANDIHGTPALARGNAVVGSPGWGIVHHDSHATLEDNVVFDVLGAGIVAESGNEIGSWHNNITLKTTGDSDPWHSFEHHGLRVQNFDMGFNGEGYWVQGAGQVVMTDNIAVSAAGAAITVFGGGDGGAEARDKHAIAVANLPQEWQNISQGRGDESMVDVAATPLRLLSGFEAYNSEKGILTWGTMLNGDGQHTMDVPGAHALPTTIPAHDYRATVENFKLWNIRNHGVQLWYTSQYNLSNGLILADTSIHENGRGIGIANNSKNHRFKNLHIQDFFTGIQLPNDDGGWWGDYQHRALMGSVLEDSYIFGVKSNFSYFADDSHYLAMQGNNTFGDPNGPNALPIASYTTQSMGGLAYRLDASSSYDPDPWNTESKYTTRGIVSYGWDFDHDGIVDKYGKTVSHVFDGVGLKPVTLTVWDQDGSTTQTMQWLEVWPQPYGDAFINGNFSQNQFKTHNAASSSEANVGWVKGSGTHDPFLGTDGALVLSTGSAHHTGISQVIQDEAMRRGVQTLQIRAKNTEARIDPYNTNQIKVSLWGINGQFLNRVNDGGQGPKPSGALPMEAVQLLNSDLGGSTYDWQTFNFEVNLGSGYNYLLAEVYITRTNQSGDYFAIDSFNLVGPSPIPPIL